jgi:hypothetical protein
MLRKGSQLIEPFRHNQWLGMALITFALAGVAGAQTTCPPPDLQPLQQPPEIDARGGVLSTTFVVKMQEHPCVPVFDGTKWTHAAHDAAHLLLSFRPRQQPAHLVDPGGHAPRAARHHPDLG